jgi:hypothetical protein
MSVGVPIQVSKRIRLGELTMTVNVGCWHAGLHGIRKTGEINHGKYVLIQNSVDG